VGRPAAGAALKPLPILGDCRHVAM